MEFPTKPTLLNSPKPKLSENLQVKNVQFSSSSRKFSNLINIGNFLDAHMHKKQQFLEL